MKVGNPAQDDSDIGSVISHDHMKKVLSYIELAKQEGGRIISGGERMILPQPNSNGSFIAPTIIEGLGIDSRCATEEIFGPVATIHKFTGDEEAIRMANGTEYGLAGSVWTADLATRKICCRKIRKWHFVGQYMVTPRFENPIRRGKKFWCWS